MSGRICGHCTNWRCDDPLHMMGHCTINRLECVHSRMCDTCTKYQCKWEYTRPEMARLIAEKGVMKMTITEKQACRKRLLKRLREIKKEAYSGVTCMEYDAINVAIHLMECVAREEERMINNE